MPFNQDDARERAMVAALNLQQHPDRVRHDADAYLDVPINGDVAQIDFECKSAPEDRDFGTGRDTGLPKLRSWSTMHFVFGWFHPRDNQPVRMWYGSPAMMRAWNLAEQEYLRLDLEIVQHAPAAIEQIVIDQLLGPAEVFTYAEIKAIVKDQWKAKKAEGRPNLYRANADVVTHRTTSKLQYSRAVAERAVRDRVHYLLNRGSTVNNRKISAGYVRANCVEIESPRWAAELWHQVELALAAEPPAVATAL